MKFIFIHSGKVFWSMFIITSICLVITAISVSIFPFDILLGLIVIVLGFGKLSEEYFGKKLMRYQDDIYQKIHQLTHQLEQNFNMTSKGFLKHDQRFFKISSIKKEINNDIEKNYRELVRKIIEVENNMNKLGKIMADQRPSKPIVLSGSFRDLVLNITRHIPKGKITTYGEIAKALGKPRASATVAQTIRKNAHRKLPLHRVIRSDGDIGSLGKMTKTNIKKKAALLRKEGVKVKDDAVDLKEHLFRFV